MLKRRQGLPAALLKPAVGKPPPRGRSNKPPAPLPAQPQPAATVNGADETIIANGA